MAREPRESGSRAEFSTPPSKRVVVWGLLGHPSAHLEPTLTHTHTPRAREDLIRAQRPH